VLAVENGVGFKAMTFQIEGIIPYDNQGSFGVTYQGIDSDTSKKVAIKIIKIDERIKRFYPQAQQRAEEEGELLKQIRHKNVVKYVHQCSINDRNVQGNLQDHSFTPDTQCLITELIDGVPLSDLINKIPDEQSLEFIVRVILQVGQALAHCHEIGIYHRDIYPKNIIVNNFSSDSVSDVSATIIDFGLGKKICTSDDCDEGYLTLGSPNLDVKNSVNNQSLFRTLFRAPELLKYEKLIPDRKEFDNQPSSYGSADLFSLVMILLWFLSQNGISNSLRKVHKFNGIEHHRTETEIARLAVIYNMLEQRNELSKWNKLDDLIKGTLVDASFINREPNTVKEWLRRLIDIFPEYENNEFVQELGNGKKIIMKKLPHQQTHISSEPITQEQWLALMTELPKSSIVNADNRASLRGVSFKNVCNFVEKLQLHSQKKYRVANKSELIELNSTEAIGNDICLWHSQNSKTYCCFWQMKGEEKILQDIQTYANFGACGIHPILFYVALENI